MEIMLLIFSITRLYSSNAFFAVLYLCKAISIRK